MPCSGSTFVDERKRKYFFLEADRATMPIMRADFDQTSFARKLITYLAGGGKNNAFGAHFGIGNFRVLTVTTSSERTATHDRCAQATDARRRLATVSVHRSRNVECQYRLVLARLDQRQRRST